MRIIQPTFFCLKFVSMKYSNNLLTYKTKTVPLVIQEIKLSKLQKNSTLTLDFEE